MRKKIFVLVIVAVLIVVAGGIFWRWQGREIKGSPEDYVIKETPEGKIVENKRAGLVVKAPEGWTEKKIEFLEGSVIFNTQDIEGVWRNEMISPPLEKGCGIETAVVYKKMNFEELKNEIRNSHATFGVRSEEFEMVTINDHQALKNIFDSKFIGPSIGIYFLNKDKFYSFAVYWAPEDKERCIQGFDKFLEKVSIQ